MQKQNIFKTANTPVFKRFRKQCRGPYDSTQSISDCVMHLINSAGDQGRLASDISRSLNWQFIGAESGQYDVYVRESLKLLINAGAVYQKDEKYYVTEQWKEFMADTEGDDELFNIKIVIKGKEITGGEYIELISKAQSNQGNRHRSGASIDRVGLNLNEDELEQLMYRTQANASFT